MQLKKTSQTLISPKKKLVFILVIIVLPLIVIKIYNENEVKLPGIEKEVFESDQELVRSLSLITNQTLIDAFQEIIKGYNNLTRQKQDNYYTAGIINGLFDNYNKGYSNILEKNKSGYLLAVYKYHSFFCSYANKLNVKNIFLIEPTNETIIYSTNPENYLFRKHPDTEIQKNISNTNHAKDEFFYFSSVNTQSYFIYAPVFFQKEKLGVAVIEYNRN